MQIVFVHGAFVRDGAWWWRPAAALIERATGVASTAVVLPSCAETGAPPTAGLFEDAAALRAVLDGLDSAIVVAHSYGGTVVAQGAEHPAVRHLVYVSSFLPEVGTPHGELIPPSADPLPVRVHDDATASVVDDDRAYFDNRFLHDVADPALVDGAHARLCPQALAALGTPTTAAAWRTVGSTYLVCAEDRSTDPGLQRTHAARATHTAELATGHHPFLSDPALVAARLAEVIDRVSAQE